MKRLLLPLAIAVLLVGGCQSAKDSGSPASAPLRANSDGNQSATKPGEGAAPPAEGTTPGKTQPIENRSLIYRADLTVRVDDVRKAADSVTSIVSTAGGFVSAEKRAIDAKESQASVTVRIPSKQFQDTLEKLAKLGREVNRGSNVEDVTEAIVDLDTRIAAQKASVESVRRMFERAGTLQDVVLLEKELTSRQAELASLEAKKRRLDDLVALSTITVMLVGPNTTIEPDKEPDPSFLGGLKSGWNAMVDALQVASAVFGFLLPFLAIIGIPLFALLWFVRFRPRRRPSGSG